MTTHVNAQLINAAPDLLEACQLFIEYEKSGDNGEFVAMMLAYYAAHDAIRAAIEKATGEAA